MNVIINCCSRKKIFFSIPLLAITIWYISIVYCENSRIINLENKILSYASKNDDELDAAKFEATLDEIDNLPTDEAMILLVRLSDYYLGEAPGEILDEKITRIGERILPYLVQKRNMPINCNKKHQDLCFENTKERNVGIEKAMEAIKKGVILYAIFPDNLEIEAKGYLKTIEIFLEDYKKSKGSLPKNLHELREYAWREYGYKLIVYNPWGQPYKYLLEANDKYILRIGDDNPYGWPRDEKETSHISPAKKKEK